MKQMLCSQTSHALLILCCWSGTCPCRKQLHARADICLSYGLCLTLAQRLSSMRPCRVSEEELASDPAAQQLTSASEEAQKVARNEGSVRACVHLPFQDCCAFIVSLLWRAYDISALQTTWNVYRRIKGADDARRPMA